MQKRDYSKALWPNFGPNHLDCTTSGLVGVDMVGVEVGSHLVFVSRRKLARVQAPRVSLTPPARTGRAARVGVSSSPG